MEIRKFAEQILQSEQLERKTARISEPFTDTAPGEPLLTAIPARTTSLKFAARRTAPAMPKADALKDPARRAIAHHIMANHELQALEVMARVLLAFPDAAPEFRAGMARIMTDEQRHTRMHVQRAAELGVNFGDYPVNGWIWQKALEYQTELQYLAGLPLVFEGANLDHTVEFESYFRDAGDRRSAAIMRSIHRDEIRHVEFGIQWLRRLKPREQSDWEAWQSNLHWPIRPSRARGVLFQRDARLAAGMSLDFIDQLQSWNDSDTESPHPE